MNVIAIYHVELNKSIKTQIIIHKSVKGRRGTRISHVIFKLKGSAVKGDKCHFEKLGNYVVGIKQNFGT